MGLIVPYKFSYLVGDLLFLIPWIILFFYRKDVRKEMIFMGLILLFMGLLYEPLWWTTDWWHPPTITGTKIGIEDFLLGFTNGGIGAVIYEVIFRMRLYKKSKEQHVLGVIVLLMLFFSITALFVWLFHISSFIATSVSMITTGFILAYLRKDLFISAFISGFLLVIVSMPVYLILMLLSPGWIEKVWDFQKLSGFLIAGIPIEDLIFYFLVGFLSSYLYKYGSGKYLRKI